MMRTPLGEQAVVLTLVVVDDSVTGTLKTSMGDIELTDGSVDDGELSWTASITAPMELSMDFYATVDGDKISGDVSLGAYGRGTFDGTRG